MQKRSILNRLARMQFLIVAIVYVVEVDLWTLFGTPEWMKLQKRYIVSVDGDQTLASARNWDKKIVTKLKTKKHKS